MNRELVFGIGGIVVGAVIVMAIISANNPPVQQEALNFDEKHTHQDMMHSDDSMKEMMSMMTEALEGKTGDEFDQAFLKDMIIHHEGAVEMAKLALQNANRQEIKDLSQAIISAQEVEISQMNTWLNEWYKQQ